MTIKEINLKFKNALSTRSSTKKIVLHHAAATTADAKTIHQWHLNNGWAGIGYHFVIRKNGAIERGRPINTIGSHCTGQNSDSVGICFEGNFETEKMSDKQIKAGQELMSYLYKMYGLNKNNVKRHKDLMSTSCPGKNFPFEEIIKGTTSVSTTKKTTTTSSTKTKTTKTSAKTTFIKGVQKSCGAKVDGIAGNETLSKTITVSAAKNNTHAVVKYLQTYLNYLGYNCGTVDGIAGTKFTAAVKSYQKVNGCVVDGEITAKCTTWKKLLGLS